MGALVWPPYELAFLARDSGHYADANIRLLEYQSPAELTRAVRNGGVEAALMTSHIALRLADSGVDLRMIYVVDISAGGDALVAQPFIASLADLENRRIGVEASPLGAFVLRRALDAADLARDQVTVVPLDIPEQSSAFRNGHVDAVVTYEPTRGRLVEHGGHVLFSSNDMPRNDIVDVVVAHKSVIETRRSDLQALVDGLVWARGFFAKHRAVAINRMAPRENLSPEAFERALEGARLPDLRANRRLLNGDAPQLLPALGRQRALMRSAELLEGSLKLAPLLDPDFVIPTRQATQ